MVEPISLHLTEEQKKQVRAVKETYKIVDAHVHIFPGKIAKKATENVSDFYTLPLHYVGYPHMVVESGDIIGIKKYLVCSVATKPEQVKRIDDFVHEKCLKYPEFLGFAGFHPDMSLDEVKRELERIVDLGLRGIKYHSDFQTFYIDDKKMLPVYKEIVKYGLPILFHMGDDRYDYSSPTRLSHVLEEIPEMTAIASHFGGYLRWEEAHRTLSKGYKNLYFDTSSSLHWLSKEIAVSLVNDFGEDHMMFGTDFPMWDYEDELYRFMSLDLGKERNQKILAGNFERLFQITV